MKKFNFLFGVLFIVVTTALIYQIIHTVDIHNRSLTALPLSTKIIINIVIFSIIYLFLLLVYLYIKHTHR